MHCTLLADEAVAHAQGVGVDMVWLPTVELEAGRREGASFGALGSLLSDLRFHLREVANVTLLTPAEAVRAVTKRYSAAGAKPKHSQQGQVADKVKQALVLGASGQWEDADEVLKGFLALGDLERDAVVFQAKLGQDLFDLCLMRVAHLQTREVDVRVSGDIMQGCIEAYPTLRPNPSYTRDSVAAQYERTKFAGRAPARLEVWGTEREFCMVAVNGVPVSLLPAKVDELVAGLVLRVQVHCHERESRVYSLRLDAGENRLTIDMELDVALRTAGGVGLQCGLVSGDDGRCAAHASTLARAVKVDAALLVARMQSSKVRLQLLTTGGASPGVSRRFRWDPRSGQRGLREAAIALAGPKQLAVGPVSADVNGMSEGQGAGEPSGTHSINWGKVTVGVGVLGVATVGALGAWSYYGLRMQYRNAIDAGSGKYLGKYDAVGKNALLVAYSANGLISAALPILLPARQESPVLQWILGSAAVVSVVAGTALTVEGHGCKRTGCKGSVDSVLGPLVLAQAMPLGSALVTYAVREATAGQGPLVRVVFGGDQGRASIVGLQAMWRAP